MISVTVRDGITLWGASRTARNIAVVSRNGGGGDDQ